MFKALMKVQWKWTRLAVLIATVVGFAIPVASVRLFMDDGPWRVSPGQIVRGMQQAGVLYAFLAGFTGLCVGFLAWNADQKGRHVYALSLPVSRARYALMRFGAGALFLLLPALGVLIGCLVAVSVANIPAGMQAYPLQVAVRFMLSCFVAFAIFFAVAAASQRAAAIALMSLAGFVLF